MYASPQWSETGEEQLDFSVLFDPALLRTARQIWRDYHENHRERGKRPLGVAINRANHRGHLLFRQKPILLPQECFIPFNQIEPEVV